MNQQNGASEASASEQPEEKTRLIINYLPQDMTQEEMTSMFSTIGSLESCKLIRDKFTGQHLGYGFVNYYQHEDAKKAIETLNGLKLQNKIIRVSYSRPSCDAIKGANLYVSGLPNGMSSIQLEALFQPYGRIISTRLLSENSITEIKKNVSLKEVGFVRYDQRTEAEEAIKHLNGTIPDGCEEPITVKFAFNPGEKNKPNVTDAFSVTQYTHSLGGPMQRAVGRFRYSPIARDVGNMPSGNFSSNTGSCIFIYNIAPEIEERDLWKLFGPFGAVQNVKIITDPQTNKCKGYGFVTMTNYDEAIVAIQSLNGYVLNNRVLQPLILPEYWL